MNHSYARNLVLFTLQVVLLLSSGCIVVGFDPKTEIRTYEKTEISAQEGQGDSKASPKDRFALSPVSVGKPVVSVSRDGDDKIRIRVEATQLFLRREVVKNYREKWEIEDNWAVSIGLLPGYGRIIYNPSSSVAGSRTDTFGGLCHHTILVPLANCFMLGTPTLSSLFFGLGETDTRAEYGLLGGDPFPTGRQAGETMIDRKIETTFAGPYRNRSGQGLDVFVMATVEIPALWYKHTATIPPLSVNGRIESATTLKLPVPLPSNTSGTVSLSFVDEAGRYGPLLKPYEGMVSPFAF